MVNIIQGVSEEKRLEIEKAIANILLQNNDTVDIHPVGHYNKQFNKVIHKFESGKDMTTYYE